MIREFFIGFIKIHILYHAAERPVYGAQLIRELARHGYALSPGTLYPTLHRLHDQGYLNQESRVVNGRVRKYYTITDKGQHALAEAREKIGELVRDVIQ
jgi:DNA-binding PadR family transcriptional regulator